MLFPHPPKGHRAAGEKAKIGREKMVMQRAFLALSARGERRVAVTRQGWPHLKSRGSLGRSTGVVRSKNEKLRSVSDSPLSFCRAWSPYLHVLLFPWHSKLSNRHSAVLHSSSHWLLM